MESVCILSHAGKGSTLGRRNPIFLRTAHLHCTHTSTHAHTEINANHQMYSTTLIFVLFCPPSPLFRSNFTIVIWCYCEYILFSIYTAMLPSVDGILTMNRHFYAYVQNCFRVIVFTKDDTFFFIWCLWCYELSHSCSSWEPCWVEEWFWSKLSGLLD